MLNDKGVEEEIKPDVKIGVYVCSCNGSFEKSIDIEPIIDHVRNFPDVVKVEHYKHLCEEEELEQIKEDIKNEIVDRVVVAGCTPSTHEDIMGNILEEAGLNRYLYEHANIREQCSWVHSDMDAATEKAMSIIAMAIAKSRLSEPLIGTEIEIKPNALVIGGGIAGMQVSLDLAQNGFKSYLVEREPELGGRTYGLNTTYPTSNCGICCMHDCKNCKLTPKIEEFYNNPNIEVLTNSEVSKIDGHIGNYAAEVRNKIGDLKKLYVGTIIISTGSKTFDPNKLPEYGYENEDVVTILELEKLHNFRRPSDGKVPETVNFILCVGSRSEKSGNPHCSLVCCNFAIGQAREIKELYPNTNVYVHYMDIRAAYQGFEEFYAEARDMGINFVRGRVAKVEKIGDKLMVRAKDMDMGILLKIKSDLVVLAVGQEPVEGTGQLAKMLNQELDIEGFIKNINPQYRSFEDNGIYSAGCVLGPKGIRHSIEDAKNAAMNAGNLLRKGRIRLSPIKSRVVDANCDGCAYCIDPCLYNALTLIEYNRSGAIKKTVERNEGKCRGCGVCAATCPKKGIYVSHYRPEQISAMIDAALEVA
ncbi:MAG: CoB--CoM heterodisulfide reductase iron-sulfur subunit A family protein [Methanomassiliicoccales archaeon]|nr:MAG: CoB--CoM heterodisulfide reductase iron-sulfur subunit A family protein [Methanomassiliicoccales archaeon]